MQAVLDQKHINEPHLLLFFFKATHLKPSNQESSLEVINMLLTRPAYRKLSEEHRNIQMVLSSNMNTTNRAGYFQGKH